MAVGSTFSDSTLYRDGMHGLVILGRYCVLGRYESVLEPYYEGFRYARSFRKVGSKEREG